MEKELDLRDQPWVDDDSDDIPEELSRAELARMSLGGRDWTTETILSQVKRGNIDLAPRFQRRDAWDPNRKSRFIESLILNLPVPQIVLAEKKKDPGKFIVLDGKQRLMSISQFAGIGSGKWNKFDLQGLEVLKKLNGISFKELAENPLLNQEFDALSNQTIRTVVIKNWPSESALHMIFVRLNTNNVPLSPQELRLALYPGPFADFIDEKSAESQPLRTLLKLSEPDFRMRDAEILLRYFAFSNRLDNYSGNMSAFLNQTTDAFNRTFDSMVNQHHRNFEDFDAALLASFNIFGIKDTARKWDGHSFESRFNRAVLDILLYYFRIPEVREQSQIKSDQVVTAYKKLFEDDHRFRDSVQSTTKSLEATFTRFGKWGEVLGNTLGMNLPIPSKN